MTATEATAIDLSRVAPADDGVASSRNIRLVLADLCLAVTAGLAATLTAIAAYGVSLSQLDLPWSSGDTLPLTAAAENLGRGNWVFTNPDLGYPGFQDAGHFPTPDLVSLLQLKVLAATSSSAVEAVNLLLLATFFTVAVFTFLVFRHLGVARLPAFAVAVAYSVVPWHLNRALGHLFLASYMSVPLGLLLIDVIARRRLVQRRTWLLFAICIGAGLVVGLNGFYYAVMTTILLAVVLLVDATRDRLRIPHWRSLAVAAVVPVSLAFGIAINYWSVSTSSAGDAFPRHPEESLIYSGAASTLFFPASGTYTGQRLAQFLDLSIPRQGEGDAQLSIAAVVAVLATCGAALFRWSRGRRTETGSAVATAAFWPGVFLLVCAFLVTNGLGALFAYWVAPEIRAWGRFSIYAVGVAFLVAGLMLTSLLRQRQQLWRLCGSVGALLLLTAAVVDVARGQFALDTAAFAATASDAEEFTEQLESDLPEGCPVMQWPVIPYPEWPPINNMGPYEHLWAYIYSQDLRFSYGGIKGTEAGDWGQAERDDPSALRERAEADGFCGAIVDTAALATPEDLRPIRAAFGGEDVASPSGRWLYFDFTGTLAPATGE